MSCCSSDHPAARARALAEGVQVLHELARGWHITRPLVAVDLETTGTDPRGDRIVSIAVLVVRPDGTTDQCVTLVNPGVPIPADATAIHGIDAARVASAPRFEQLAGTLHPFFVETDVVGYNVRRFDLEMLQAEFARARVNAPCGCRILDPLVIWQRREPRTLEDAQRYFLHEAATTSHEALADTVASIRVLRAQCVRYALPGVDELADYCERRDASWVDERGRLRWRDGEVVLGFGRKHCGERLRDVISQDPEFIDWMLGADFPEDTKAIVADARRGNYPEPAS